MALTVRERGETAATLRHIHVALMEMVASWVPTTPEMEAKLLFGAHVWDLAQHADALGKRTYELRMPLQHSLPPCAPYQELLAGLARTRETPARIAGLYDGVLVGLERRYRDYLSRTDSLLDAPSVRILEHIAAEQTRMIAESRQLLDEIPALRLDGRELVSDWLAREVVIPDLIAHAPEPAVPAP